MTLMTSGAALKAISQNPFQNCFEGWTRRWHRCIASQGEYFEGDHGGIQNEVCSTFTALNSRTLLTVLVYPTYNHSSSPNECFLFLEIDRKFKANVR